MNKSLANILGWYGAIAVLVGYALISFGVLGPQELTYELIVVTGTAGLVIVSLVKKVYQTALLNAVAFIIGLVAIINILVRG